MTHSHATNGLGQDNDQSANDSLLAARGKPREIKVNQLVEPDLNLSYSYNPKDRQLTVQLRVPNSSGDERQVPFLAVTRDPTTQHSLLTQAQRTVLSETNGELAAPIKVSGEAGGKFKVIEFKVSVSGEFNPNRDLGRVMAKAESEFDNSRQEIYRERAVKWTQDGGARIAGKDANGRDVVYQVSDEAGLGYLKFSDQRYNNQHPGGAQRGLETSILEGIVNERRNRRGDADIESPNAAIASASGDKLVKGNDRINKLFEQALKGAGGDKDLAAAAVQTISSAAGFKPDQEISVVQGKFGPIVSQGEGAAGLNLPVPQSKQGDFEKISAQMTAQPQQTQQIASVPTEQQERKPMSL